jgi:hypothetical protein
MDRARKEIDSLRAYNEMLLKVEREHVAEVERLRTQHENDMHTIDTGSRANAGLEIENERLRAALEKIANTQGVLHSSWHVATARDALGRANCC